MEIKPYPKNAKKHPDKQLEQIAKSIQEFGWQQPIVVDSEGVIIVGHGRWAAYEKYKDQYTLPAPEIKEAILTKEQANAYRLADNKLNESDWDMQLAIDELKELPEDLQRLTGFDLDLLIEPDEKDDVIPEDAPPVAKLGDLWALGRHRLLCGDATKIEDVERLMDGKKADMVFTDPPYGVDYSGGIQFTKTGEVKKEQRSKLIADDSEDIYAGSIPMMALFCNGPIYTWFAGTKAKTIYTEIEKVGDLHSLIIWVKNGGYGAMNANYKQKHEPCLYWKNVNGKLNFCGATTETTIWNIDKDGVNKLHPTQKPVALATKAILNHSVGSILDLFGGSGSTLIACEKTNRMCYMSELDPKYVSVILQRWADYTGQDPIREDGVRWSELCKSKYDLV